MSVYQYKELTGEIIHAAHVVHNALGYGFLEKVYHKALAVELARVGKDVVTEKNCWYDTKEWLSENFMLILLLMIK